jgi:3-hydroxyacyl-CoA dehydrogenase
VFDLAGLDIAWAPRKRAAATRDPEARDVGFPDRICNSGWFGQKTGRGFYRYPDGTRQGQEDPKVLDMIAFERKLVGVTPRSFTAGEIQQYCLMAMVNEGARLLEEQIAQRPSDIDTVLIHGYGYPRWRGGPMKTADIQGLLGIQTRLHQLEQEDPLFWKTPDLLKHLVRDGRNFDDLNAV